MSGAKIEEIENKEEVISALNQILKGEHMAIDFYNDYIEQAETGELKELLQKFQQDHKEHASLISTRIQNIGAIPNEGRGVAGFMSNTMMEVGTLLGIKPTNNKEISEEIYNGEQKGINKVEEIMNQKLDSESQKIVSEIISTDHKHLKKLKELLGGEQ